MVFERVKVIGKQRTGWRVSEAQLLPCCLAKSTLQSPAVIHHTLTKFALILTPFSINWILNTAVASFVLVDIDCLSFTTGFDTKLDLTKKSFVACNKTTSLSFIHWYIISEERKKIHCLREFSIKDCTLLFRTQTLTAGSLQLFSFRRQGWLLLACLRVDPPPRLDPASPTCLQPPPSNFLHLLQESNWTPGLLLADKTQNLFWLVGIEGRRLEVGKGRWGAAARELWEREAKGDLFIVILTIESKWLKPSKNAIFRNWQFWLRNFS